MGTSIGILNNIRANASEEYQSRIPVATQENIVAVGNALQQYTVLYNEFCDALMHKIGKTILETKLFSNRLAVFKSGTVNTAQDVEEIFIEMAKAEGAYDPAGTNPLGRRNPADVSVIYHRQNRRDVYATSIGDIDFKRGFTSESTLDAFIKGLINSIYSGAAYDEWCAMKNLLATYDGYATAEVENKFTTDTAGVGEAAAKHFVKTVRKLINDLSFPSTQYNKAGVKTWCEAGDLVLLINKDLLAEIDVEVLAKSYNMGKTDVQITVVPMDDFGTLADTAALLVDKNFFRVYDTLSHMETQRNAHGLFTNYFYHVHQILSLSTFKNAVQIKFKAAA